MKGWEPTRIRWVTETLPTSTGATRVETDLGPAYVKLMGNGEGPQALFCERLGTRAAAWLGLPIFATAVIDVREPGLVTYADGSVSSTGPAFAARYESGFTWDGNAPLLESLENPEAVSGLVVLDTWLLNCDRYRAAPSPPRCNTRNVFLSSAGATKGNVRLLAMDHTHILTCGAPLTLRVGHIDRVRDARLSGNFPGFRSHLSRAAVRRFATRLAEFKKQDAAGLLEDMPRAWSPASDVQAAVVNFLVDRAAFVAEKICDMLVDQGELPREPEVGE